MNHALTVSVQEAATALGVARSTVYESIRRGDFPLPVIRIGARRLISRAALERLLAEYCTVDSDAA